MVSFVLDFPHILVNGGCFLEIYHDIIKFVVLINFLFNTFNAHNFYSPVTRQAVFFQFL